MVNKINNTQTNLIDNKTSNSLFLIKKEIKNVLTRVIKNKTFQNILVVAIGFVILGIIIYSIYKTILLINQIDLLQTKNAYLASELECAEKSIDELKNQTLTEMKAKVDALDKKLVEETRTLELLDKEIRYKKYALYWVMYGWVEVFLHEFFPKI